MYIVAAAGLPKPRIDHAVVMARFGSECMAVMNILTRKLDVLYGPETGELSLRVGIHSGPVTGGFLKGKRPRFQLFGDTMNTASRIEETSEPGHIHVSDETAQLLRRAGKSKWLLKRESKVHTKGKGELQTYWLDITIRHRRRRRRSSGASSSAVSSSIDSTEGSDRRLALKMLHEADTIGERTKRLVQYNVEVLVPLLKQIVARRRNNSASSGDSCWRPSSVLQNQGTTSASGKMPLEEVKEIIILNEFDARAAKNQQRFQEVDISQTVVSQLQLYVTCIAQRYQQNPFHNFDHASHVVAAVMKFMSRIVAPSDIDSEEGEGIPNKTSAAAAVLHDHTYGIVSQWSLIPTRGYFETSSSCAYTLTRVARLLQTSDPITQFACAFSALIHDVDHPGVPNPQFIKEQAELATLYKARSVAEQNSFDIGK